MYLLSNKLLSFSHTLAIKCLSLNDEPCMLGPILFYLNTTEPKYYQFMISLDKFTESCNVLSPKVCIPKETKYINVKTFNMMTKQKLN